MISPASLTSSTPLRASASPSAAIACCRRPSASASSRTRSRSAATSALMRLASSRLTFWSLSRSVTSPSLSAQTSAAVLREAVPARLGRRGERKTDARVIRGM